MNKQYKYLQLTNQSNIILGCFVLLFLNSCSFFKGKDSVQDLLIAQVGDSKLYYSDLQSLSSDKLTPKDSSHLVQTFAEEWVRHQLILKQAEKNKDLYSVELEKQIKDYSESLMIYYYQNELVKSKIDSVFSNQEINDYYNQHAGEFTLNSDILKCAYIITDKNAPVNDTLSSWLKNWDPNSINNLQNYCDQYGILCHLQHSKWISKAEFTKNVPIFNLNNSLSQGIFSEQDSVYKYNVKVFQIMPVGSNAPVEYVTEDIQLALYNKRKVAFFKDVNNKIYEDGIKSKSFEIFHSDKK